MSAWLWSVTASARSWIVSPGGWHGRQSVVPHRWLPRRSARRLHRLRSLAGGQPPDRGLPGVRWLTGRHRFPAFCCLVVVIAAGAWLLGGPVAAGAAGGYTFVGILALGRRWRDRASEAATIAALDAVAVLAADLRAGLAPAHALAHASPAIESSAVEEVRRIAAQVAAAWRVADVAGIRLADLLDRLEADARGLRRVRAVGAAEAAGARATAWLLAGLPAAGIALGYGMGTDPGQVLLHTPLGALCAGLAAAFQVTGLAWSGRLAKAVSEVC